MLYADGAELINGEDTEHFNEVLCKTLQGRNSLLFICFLTSLRTGHDLGGKSCVSTFSCKQGCSPIATISRKCLGRLQSKATLVQSLVCLSNLTAKCLNAPHDVGLEETLCWKKKAGGEREEVWAGAHRITGRECLALRAGALVYLSFKLMGGLMRQKEISFERARRQTFSPHTINSPRLLLQDSLARFR